MNCLITNGSTYIKLDENGQPVTCVKHAAQIFPEEKARNILNCLPKTFKKFHFKIKPIYINETSQIETPQITESDLEEIQSMDDWYEDYNNAGDKDNFHVYSGKTSIEELEDVPGELKRIVRILSQMDIYIENMEYMQRELDLKILDIRHYIRNNETKLGSVHMGKIGYMLQDLERQRAECKMNKNSCLIFQKDFERFRKSKYIKVLDEMSSSEYRYRRLDQEEIKGLIGKK